MKRHGKTRSFELLALVFVIGCGSGSGGGGGTPGGSGPWSLRQYGDGGILTDCTNFVAAPRPASLMGATISSEVCPSDGTIAGVCAGTNAGGYAFQQVWYDPPATAASVPYLMLSCTASGWTFSTTYVPPAWTAGGGGAGSGGAGGSGAAGGGGATGGPTCADLQTCCQHVSDTTQKQVCQTEYDQLKGAGASGCAAVLMSFRNAGFCS